MDSKEESQWWWFDNNKNSNCSPWLESTLADLNEKTKTMLKLVEGDADSFAQRAEMYYRKRPELISLVQDFYQAHRSLAEQFNHIKTGRAVHVKSPLKHLLSSPNDPLEYKNGVDSISSKSLGSETEVSYSCDESAESEVDDPEVDDDILADLVELKKENSFSKLKEELDRLREENEIQRNQIKVSYQEKEELVSEIKKLREEFQPAKADKTPFEDVKQEIMKIEEENNFFEEALVLKEKLLKLKEEDKEDAEKKLEKAKKEVMKLREETQRKDRNLIEALDEKDEDKRSVIRQLSLAMDILREDNQFLKKTVSRKVSDSPPKKKNPFQFSSKWFKSSSKCLSMKCPENTVL